MKKRLIALALIAAGGTVGGGSAYGTARLLGGKPLIQWQRPREFLPTGPMTAPLVTETGRLAGYMQFQAELEVPGDQLAAMRARLPLLHDAMTLRTFKVPMASGPDGLLPRIETFRRVLEDASRQVYGDGRVSRVVVTQAELV